MWGPLVIWRREWPGVGRDRLVWRNSGVDFDLEDGSTQAVGGKQYGHTTPAAKRRTEKTKSVACANILGNVLGMVSEAWHDTMRRTVGWLLPAAGEVRRAASCAAGVLVRRGAQRRSAFRYHDVPSYRLGGIGFRCARGQSCQRSDPARRPAAHNCAVTARPDPEPGPARSCRRCTPEYERVVAKGEPRLPYRPARTLLRSFCRSMTAILPPAWSKVLDKPAGRPSNMRDIGRTSCDPCHLLRRPWCHLPSITG